MWVIDDIGNELSLVKLEITTNQASCLSAQSPIVEASKKEVDNEIHPWQWYVQIPEGSLKLSSGGQGGSASSVTSSRHRRRVSAARHRTKATVVAEMRSPWLFFLFLLPFLLLVSGDTRALRNRLITLAKGLPFTRWRNSMARPHGPRQRIKRPLEDRFARAPILTRYTPLIMDEDIKAPKAPLPKVKEVIVTVEEPVVQQQYNNNNNNNNNSEYNK